MRLFKKIDRLVGYTVIGLAHKFKPGLATGLIIRFYTRWGIRFIGTPNYISAKVDFDGGNFSLIEIHEGATISSYVRVLTHDYALWTVGRELVEGVERPRGATKPVVIGPNSFIGTGSIVMPGAKIGRNCLIGAGTVVRGEIPDFSVVVGSPGRIIADTRDYVKKSLERLADSGAA